MSEGYLGKEIKKLGFGFMRLPQLEGGVLDMSQTKEMVDRFLEAGGTYFDTAVPYLGQRSELALKECLVDRHPRESYQIATKLSFPFLSPELNKEQMFAQSLERIGVDYVDFYLLHSLNRGNLEGFNKIGAWDFGKALKAEGKIKHFGFSFHDKAALLDEVLQAHPEVEFVQLQLNYADWDRADVESKLCYQVALRHNKPILIMEPVKGGTLATLPPQAEEIFRRHRPEDSMAAWALRYCLSLDNIITILSGMSTLAQVEDNLATLDKLAPMEEADFAAVAEVVSVLDQIPQIPCTSCNYCVEDCPAKINIPKFFSLMNTHIRFGDPDGVPTNIGGFLFNSRGVSKPSDCLSCGKCEKNCPQNIPIIQDLKRVATAYERG